MKSWCMIIGVTLVLLGCGGDDKEPSPDSGTSEPLTGDTYRVGLEKQGEFLTTRLVDALPAPPERGDNEWTLEVLEDGVPQIECLIAVTPTMPAHGHGTKPVGIIEMGDGRYSLKPLDLFMPGLWVVKIDLTCASSIDTVTYKFWIEG